MADYSDLYKQLAFLQAGGGQEDAYDKINKIFGTVTSGAKSIYDIKKTQQDIIKSVLEKKKLEAETKKIEHESDTPFPYSVKRPETEVAPEREAYERKIREKEEFISGVPPGTPPNIVEELAGEYGVREEPTPPKLEKEKMLTTKEYTDVIEAEARKKFYENPLGRPEQVYYDPTLQKVFFENAPGRLRIPASTGAGLMMQGERTETTRQDRIDKMVMDTADRMENHPTLKKIREESLSSEMANRLNELATSGNTVAAASMGMKQARRMGEVGVATETDVVRYVQSAKLSQRAADILLRWIEGKPTDATLKDIIEINKTLVAIADEKAQAIYNSYINRLSVNLDITPEEAARRLAVPYNPNIGKKSGKIEDAKPQESINIESPGQILDSLLSDPSIPNELKNKAKVARILKRPEEEIIKALKIDAGIK